MVVHVFSDRKSNNSEEKNIHNRYDSRFLFVCFLNKILTFYRIDIKKKDSK